MLKSRLTFFKQSSLTLAKILATLFRLVLKKGKGSMAQVVECMICKPEALSSNSSSPKKQKRSKRQE
jgi:hypothetical protein